MEFITIITIHNQVFDVKFVVLLQKLIRRPLSEYHQWFDSHQNITLNILGSFKKKIKKNIKLSFQRKSEIYDFTPNQIDNFRQDTDFYAALSFLLQIFKVNVDGQNLALNR